MSNPAKSNENSELELSGSGQPLDSYCPSLPVLAGAAEYCFRHGNNGRKKKCWRRYIIDVGFRMDCV